MTNLCRNRHHSRYLQNAWNKHGPEQFQAILIEIVSEPHKLEDREQSWIDNLNAYQRGFNARPSSESMRGIKWSQAQNQKRRASNRATWSNPALRQALSKRFKGIYRAAWTDESKLKASQSLKAFHVEHPSFREKFRSIVWDNPINAQKRIEGVRRSLGVPKIYEARIKQLREASKSPKRLVNLRQMRHAQKGYYELGFSTFDDLTRHLVDLYSRGLSLREIGRLCRLDHKSVAARLRNTGTTIETRYRKGNRHPFAKLDENKVRLVRKLLKAGKSASHIASSLGVSAATIYDIRRGKNWKHID